MQRTKGFTLIELLVVISIIALLSSVVLSSLNSARTKTADNAVKAAMKQIAIQTEVYRDTNNTFGASIVNCTTGVFADTRISEQRANVLSNALSGATMACFTNAGGTRWALSVSDLKSSGVNPWCVDNSGNFRSSTAQNTGQCQ